jgi:hypothetical protein
MRMCLSVGGFLKKLFRGTGGLPPGFKALQIEWGLGCVLAHFGGNWNNGANCGPWYWNLNNSTTNKLEQYLSICYIISIKG